MEVLANNEALARLRVGAVERLTHAATAATFYAAPLTEVQLAANRRVVDISTSICETAAISPSQHFAAAFIEDRFAGYVIGTRHAPKDHELDWLMVHPDFHGTPVSTALMNAGMHWLGHDQPIWLTVIQSNQRAIRFYEKFGFAIDPDARTAHVVPHHIMRRPALAR
jgi:ribosomal protein S18 acetylase RimI-like enzyme